jgi:hypothetical protein
MPGIPANVVSSPAGFASTQAHWHPLDLAAKKCATQHTRADVDGANTMRVRVTNNKALTLSVERDADGVSKIVGTNIDGPT